MTTKPLRAAIYVRQSVREDQGIAQQIEECTRRVNGEKWELIDTYDDNTTSATKARGEGTHWARMLADIDSGRIDVVVAVTAARLLRRTEDVLEITRRGVRVVTTRDGIDTVSTFGRAILMILVAIAESEIEEKEARAIPYRAARREAGHPTAGLVPYGYRWVPKIERDKRGTRFEIVPEEAEIIRLMSSMLLDESKLGESNLGEIAQALRDLGTTTRRGATWSTTTVRRILISPYPAGMLPPPMPEGEPYRADRFTWSECTRGAWEAILDEDAVIAARSKLLKDSRRVHDGDTRAKWLLSSIGRCGACGGPLRMATTKTANPERGYRCTKGCFQRPARLIEEYISDAVVEVLSAPGLLSWVDDGEYDVQALRTRQEALGARRAEAQGLYRDNVLDAPTLREIVAQLDAEEADVDRDLAEAMQADPLAQFVTGDDVRGIWETLPMGRRRAVLKALVHDVRVHPVGKGRRVRTVEEIPATVTMGWRRIERRRSIETGETTSRPVPGVVPAAEDIITTAIGSILRADEPVEDPAPRAKRKTAMQRRGEWGLRWSMARDVRAVEEIVNAGGDDTASLEEWQERLELLRESLANAGGPPPDSPEEII